MPKNLSIERFRQLTEDLKDEVRFNAISELNRQAQLLADSISAVAPVYTGEAMPGVEAGALKTTVGVAPDRTKPTIVRVIAGGAQTTRQSASGKDFDYSRAVEFGTVNMSGQPFFFPTYRLMKKRIIASMKRRIAANIKKYSAEGKSV